MSLFYWHFDVPWYVPPPTSHNKGTPAIPLLWEEGENRFILWSAYTACHHAHALTLQSSPERSKEYQRTGADWHRRGLAAGRLKVRCSWKLQRVYTVQYFTAGLCSEPEFLNTYWRLKSRLFEESCLSKGQSVQQGSQWLQFCVCNILKTFLCYQFELD